MNRTLLLFCFIVGIISCAYSVEKPNVIIFITDDQGYADLSCHGNDILETPALDKFIDESVEFTNMHTGPTCAPTRAGIMTGRYCNSTGLWHTIMQRAMVRKDEVMLPEIFKRNGYKTALFGKWHLGDTWPYRPIDRGFDHVISHGGGGIGQTPDYWGNDYFDDTYSENGELRRFVGYCTDVWVEEAMKYIEMQVESKTPFFCYISTNAPHSPYNVSEKYSSKYSSKTTKDRANFYGMISNIDENFLKLKNKLKDLNIEENTILIFMTDNGSACGAKTDKKGNVTEGYNAGMRGIKGSPYEGGHRVPFAISYPALLKGHRKINSPVSHIDIFPTLLKLCGIEVSGGKDLAGRSLVGLIQGDKNAEAFFNERIFVIDSQRVDFPKRWRNSCVVKGKYRLINGIELFDISKDISQKNNIIRENPQIVKELKNAYESWFENVFCGDYLKYNPFYIDKKHPQVLDSHYWQGDEYGSQNVWNQHQIRGGKKGNGFWEIEVLEAGKYSFRLSRYPVEFGKPITWGDNENYKALNIKMASLEIDGQLVNSPKNVQPADSFVEYKVFLSKGRHKVKTYFIADEFSLGAYYVYIK